MYIAHSGKHVSKLMKLKVSVIGISPDSQTGKILPNESDQFKLPRGPFKGDEILKDDSRVGGGLLAGRLLAGTIIFMTIVNKER